jgi:hypothetical protein
MKEKVRGVISSECLTLSGEQNGGDLISYANATYG